MADFRYRILVETPLAFSYLVMNRGNAMRLIWQKIGIETGKFDLDTYDTHANIKYIHKTYI